MKARSGLPVLVSFLLLAAPAFGGTIRVRAGNYIGTTTTQTFKPTVTSNEPANGLGDGDTGPDFEIVDATHVRLRAERSGSGSGRTYTVGVTCGDATTYTFVTVPKK